MKKTFTFLTIIFSAVFTASAQNFTSGNLAVLVAAESNSNTTASIVELSPGVAGQVAVRTTAIDGAGAKMLRFSGSASSTGYLSRSADGTLLTFTGHTALPVSPATNINTVLARAVGTLNYKHEYEVATNYSNGSSGDQARSATTLDNINWVIADQRGLFTNNSSARFTGSANSRSVKSFGSVAYSLSSNLVNTLALTPTTGGPITAVTATGLPGLSAISNMQDFYLVSSGTNGSMFDILYVLSNSNGSSNTDGTISKFSLVAGTWVANGTYATTFAGFGLAVAAAENTANLYITTGAGALTGNSVIKLTDLAGYNAAININTASNVTLYTAAAGTMIKGIDFAPINPATLPIKLTSFTGKSLINGAVKFSWTTSEEKNFSHFELEESIDGKSFGKIARVESKKQATGGYYEHTTVRSGNYFRLKSVDLDGTSEYSKVIYIATKTGAGELVVFPNPTTDKITVQLHTVAANNRLVVVSSTGKIVKNLTFKGSDITLSVADLAKGVYYARVVDEISGEVYAKSFLVQ